MFRLLCLTVFCVSFSSAQPRRVLYVTHSAGFEHDSLPVSAQVLQTIAAQSGKLEVVATKDVALISEEGLRPFDAVFFFTSGELPMSDTQKRDLLAFIRGGKGFGGAHSATDTFYQWPEYGELIGARFNGHPWVQEVRIDVEDPDHPAVAHLSPRFSILDEIYQFRDFDRKRVRVLMTLDTRSVDVKAPGTNPGTEDFPLAWASNFGQGRTFYTALGHFDGTWRDPRFQRTLLEAMLWLTGQVPGEASPRSQTPPEIFSDGLGNAASFQPRMTISAGSLISIYGRNLTSGSTLAGDARDPPYRLTGTEIKLNGTVIPVLFASPAQVNVFVPFPAQAEQYSVQVSTPLGMTARTAAHARSTPGIFLLTNHGTYVTLWGTGLGTVARSSDLFVTTEQPTVTVNGAPARVLFSGLAPGWFGLYQVNVELPSGVPASAVLQFTFAGYEQRLPVQP